MLNHFKWNKGGVDAKFYWIFFMAAMLLKYGYYRFAYYPVLDDWIQYGGYPLYKNPFVDVILNIKTYTTRPLATFFDIYVWGQMWEQMWIAFFIITILHIISAYFLFQIFQKNDLEIGLPVLLVYGLLPLGTEATYWISASSRLVVGMFFCLFSLYCLTLYFTKERRYHPSKAYLWAFALLQFVSFCYYEQIIAIGFVGALLILFVQRHLVQEKVIWFIPWINLFLIGGYYVLFSHIGNTAQRGQMVDHDFLTRWFVLFKNIVKAWFKPHLQMYLHGVPKGIQILLENQSYIYMILILCGAIILFYISFKEESEEDLAFNMIKFALGIFLFIIPFGPFFFLAQGGSALRNTFPSFIGLGLMIEAVMNAFLYERKLKMIKSTILSLVFVVFLLANIAELTDYRNVSLIDRRIGEEIIAHVKQSGVSGILEGENRIVVLNPKRSYIEQNALYGEHIMNATSSDWALTGMVRGVERNVEIKYLITVYNGGALKIDEETWTKHLLLGITDAGKVKRLRPSSTSGKEIRLLDESNKEFGVLRVGDKEIATFTKNLR